jgi:hypothetical protein
MINSIFYIVLETVKAAQMHNGLRHRDFQRYRQYCARRLRRIRKSVKFTHGKGKIFLNKKVDAETATEARCVCVCVCVCARYDMYSQRVCIRLADSVLICAWLS